MMNALYMLCLTRTLISGSIAVKSYVHLHEMTSSQLQYVHVPTIVTKTDYVWFVMQLLQLCTY